MTTVAPGALAGHQFLRGAPPGFVERLADAATLVTLRPDQRLFDEGGTAMRFWLIRVGQVALDMNVPGRGVVTVETLGQGDIVGLSWLFPPYQWQFGAVAVQPTEAFQMDARAVRVACDADPALGYFVTRRVMAVTTRRLQATRMRLLDLYARPAERA